MSTAKYGSPIVGVSEDDPDSEPEPESEPKSEPHSDVDNAASGPTAKYGSPIVEGSGSELGIDGERELTPEPTEAAEAAAPTEHIRERWDQRTPEDAVGIETALRYAFDLGVVRDFEFFTGGWADDPPDAVLGYAGETIHGEAYHMVLIFRDEKVVTTIPASWLIVGGRQTVAGCSSQFTPYAAVDERTLQDAGGDRRD